MIKANQDIRSLAESKNVRMWQIADRYGLHEGNFSRKMRKPLSDADRERIISIINEIANEEV